MDEKKRARAGMATGAAGIAANLILAGLKIAAGIMFSALPVAADGFNNLSDCAGDAAAVVSFKVGGKPADKEHPFGHRRAEYIASLVIGLSVLFVAAELLRESVAAALEGATSALPVGVFAVLGVSIAVKAGMYAAYRVQAGRLQSETLRAAATDSAADCLATSAVIAGALVSRFSGLPADGYAGGAVALFIAWQGITVLKKAASELLGKAPDGELVRKVKNKLLSGENVLGVHDLKIYAFGRGADVATAHVEMPASTPPLEAHAVIDGLEHEIATELGVTLTAHLDPVDLADAEALELERKAREAAEGLADGLEFHDFRLVRGVKNKLIFEAGVPFSCPRTNEELEKRITEEAGKACMCAISVTVERE